LFVAAPAWAQQHQKKQMRAEHPKHQSWRQHGYRAYGAADPSFDRYGRPYRPQFYSPCTVDLGYGRFARCDGSL
jgi:hypothetical protein